MIFMKIIKNRYTYQQIWKNVSFCFVKHVLKSTESFQTNPQTRYAREVSKRIPRLATLVGAYGAGFVFQLCWFQYSSNFLDKRNIEPKTIGNLLQTRIAYRMYACRYAYIYAYICICMHICAYIRVYEYIQDGRHDEAYHRCLSFIWIFSWF